MSKMLKATLATRGLRVLPLNGLPNNLPMRPLNPLSGNRPWWLWKLIVPVGVVLRRTVGVGGSDWRFDPLSASHLHSLDSRYSNSSSHTPSFKPFTLVYIDEGINKLHHALAMYKVRHERITCVLSFSAWSRDHGASEPGSLNTIFSSSTGSSATYVILINTVAPGGMLPTLTVNTSYIETRGLNYFTQKET